MPDSQLHGSQLHKSVRVASGSLYGEFIDRGFIISETRSTSTSVSSQTYIDPVGDFHSQKAGAVFILLTPLRLGYEAMTKDAIHRLTSIAPLLPH